MDLLSGLVEKSLVVAKGSDEGGVRYRLLEPVRQYALERLEESGEAEAAKRAHAQHFLAMAEEAEPELLGPRETEWYDRLEQEHDSWKISLVAPYIQRHDGFVEAKIGGVLLSTGA